MEPGTVGEAKMRMKDDESWLHINTYRMTICSTFWYFFHFRDWLSYMPERNRFCVHDLIRLAWKICIDFQDSKRFLDWFKISVILIWSPTFSREIFNNSVCWDARGQHLGSTTPTKSCAAPAPNASESPTILMAYRDIPGSHPRFIWVRKLQVEGRNWRNSEIWKHCVFWCLSIINHATKT